MIQLEITLQVLGIVALLIFIVILGYVLYMLQKFSKKLDTIIEIITYYEKMKMIVTDFMEGPGQRYLSAAQMIFSFVSPLLTNRRKSK